MNDGKGFKLGVLALCCGVLVLGCAKAPPDAKTGDKPTVLIGLSLADLKEERWKRDLEMFKDKVRELGGRVAVQDAGGDAQVQIEQCKNLLLHGVKTLVVVPKNADAAAPIVRFAHEKGVKVISYDRLIMNAPTDLYLSFDNYKVGEIQAREILKRVPKGKYLLLGGDPADQNAFMLRDGQLKILKPFIDRGDIEIVADPFCDKWQRSEARRYTEDNLAQHPDLAAVVASNDGTAAGAIAALQAKGKAGRVFVSGQDADLEACRNIAKGLQAVTVYKPIQRLAHAAAVIAVALAQGTGVDEFKTLVSDAGITQIDNGKTRVPTLFLEPVAVTQENMDETVIADRFHTREDVYGR